MRFESRLEKYLGSKAKTIIRSLLKPPSEERYRVPGEEFEIKKSRGIAKVQAEELLENIRYKAELRRAAGEIFLAVKLENRPRPSPDQELEEIKLDRIGAIRALVGRSVRGKNILTTDARPGRKYNVRVHKGQFIGVGYLADRPKSSRVALYMQSSPRFLPDLRGSEMHELGMVHPIPRGPTLAMLEEDVEGKKVVFVPAPEDMGIAAMLAKRGAKVYIATTLRGLLNRIRKIHKRLGLKIETFEGDPTYIPERFDYAIVHPISSDYGLRPQPYVEQLSWSSIKRFVKIQVRHLLKAAMLLRPGGHLIYVANTIDPEEYARVVEELFLAYPHAKQVHPGVDGMEVNLFGKIYATLVTRDEGPYFMASRFILRAFF